MEHSELLINDLCTQGFHIRDNFLNVAHYKSLCALSRKTDQEGLFKSAKIGLKTEPNETIRSDKICWLDETSSNPAIQAYLNQTLNLAKILNQSLFLNLVEFETHFAVYPAGAFYKKHCDQFASQKTRKISCVYYLNEPWQEAFGGTLKLYNSDDQIMQNVMPHGNRFICFNSELAHEVCLTHQPRYSIAGWMKTRPLSAF